MTDDRIKIFVDSGGPLPPIDPSTHVYVNYVEPGDPHATPAEPRGADLKEVLEYIQDQPCYCFGKDDCCRRCQAHEAAESLAAERRGAEGAPVDLAMWHRVLALSDNTMQPVIRNDLAALVALTKSLAAEVARLRDGIKAAVDSCEDKDPSVFGPRYCDCHHHLAALGTKGAGDGE